VPQRGAYEVAEGRGPYRSRTGAARAGRAAAPRDEGVDGADLVDHGRAAESAAAPAGEYPDDMAATCVPSTEKCSSDKSPRTSLWFNSSARNLCATSALRSRSRFFVNTVGTHTGSSTPSPPAAVAQAQSTAVRCRRRAW
jgi:hypothetical protein